MMTSLSIYLLACSLARVYGTPLKFENTAKKAPTFCHELDCPKFSIVENFDTYELRDYSPSVWVATNLTAMTYTDQDTRLMFDRLFYYISGNNSEHKKIAMTAPVLRTILHGQGPDCESTFTMHFMVPFALQEKPPAPTDPRVYITRLESLRVYVRSFGGYLNGTDIQNNLQALADDIGESSKFVANPYYAAGYDNPYQVLNRHNEVWLEKAN